MSYPVLALGAWLKNAACLLEPDGTVVWSPLHGDLGAPQACMALAGSADGFLQYCDGQLSAVAHDLHPDSFSTQLAQSLAHDLEVPAIGVQHHHAHLAVVLAEQAQLGQPIVGPVVGLALDGVGLGSDGTAWGGELLLLDGASCTRLGHLQPLHLPGGDTAAREPWRMAAAVLHALGRGDEIAARFGQQVGDAQASGVAQMLARGLNCPVTTSTGRWFDAAAAALGLCLKQDDEAQAAIALEQAATRWLAGNADPVLDGSLAPVVAVGATAAGEESSAEGTPPDLVHIDLRPLLARLFELGDNTDEGAALFHLTLADALARAAITAARQVGSDHVLLGGGCFFNRLLTERLTRHIEAAGLRVLKPVTVSCGDAGLALGQAWVAQQQLTLLQEQSSTASPAASTENGSCA
ncbi:MAG: carbamoyltransferase HypF [Burkholderiales bacterium]|nr:carbamoyltransferase HypF [Burkholderiales bacterium]